MAVSISQIFLVFDGVLLRYFVGCPSVAVCLSFSHASTGVMGFERKTMEVNEVVLITSSQGCAVCSVAQWCPTLCGLWTVAHQIPLSMGILQARILEWVAIPSSRGSSQPRDQTQVSRIAGRFFTD